jgi:serine/threonine protein kinase
LKPLIVVLYSAKQKLWKIADFGYTAEGTATGPKTTQFFRGSSSYRAPELVHENGSYTSKVDIWALGCIIHELAFSETVFGGDWEVHIHAITKSKLKLPASSYPDFFQANISETLEEMLDIDWRQRPDASSVCAKLPSHCQTVAEKMDLQVAVPTGRVSILASLAACIGFKPFT